MSDEPQNPLEGLLSEFALGPSWARAKSDTPAKKYKDVAPRDFEPRRRDDRRDSRQGGGAIRGRDDRGGDRRQSGGGAGGNRRNFDRNARGRDDFRREEIPPAEGVTVTLIPEKQAIQLICKEVHQVARVYPLFDIAQIILAERSRSRATFEISEKKEPFYRCKIEEALYLTKEEALAHLLAADWRNRFIEEATYEVDPPKGNFQSVAKCGLSGEWLGPPNYHDYQTNLRRLHRERFANMPFEAYAAKVRTERSEEAVAEWMESMKTRTRWRILTAEESATVAADGVPLGYSIRQAEPEPKTIPAGATEAQNEESLAEPAPEPPEPLAEETEAPTEPSATEEAPAEEPEETPAPEATAEEETPADPPEEAPTPAEEPSWFTDRAEFERALMTDVLERTFHATRKAKLSAAVIGKHLSPGLLVRLKGTGNHHRKHPAILIPVICKILEAEHMPVFKRKGKLFTGPARPHALAADAVLAPRPAEMVKWIRENTPAKLEGLWKAVLPEGATAPPAEYAADLFWLLQQGHILLYTDDTLVVQEKPKPQEPKKPKQPKKKAETATQNSETAPQNPETAPQNPETAPQNPEAAPQNPEAAPQNPETEPQTSETASQNPEAEPQNPETAPQNPEAAPQNPETAPQNPTPPLTQPPSPTSEAPLSDPAEIIKDAVKDIVETVSNAASELIDSAISATPPENPEKPTEAPDQKPLP